MITSSGQRIERDSMSRFDLTLEIHGADQLVRVLSRLGRMPEVLSVQRVAG
jgi:(p)ppGpp synthase/HD superfamily hydrolase